MTSNSDRLAALTKWRLLGTTSCVGCKFLYARDTGYSNYTVEDTTVDCMFGLNPNLPSNMPYDWRSTTGSDNWPKTNQSRCERFSQLHGNDAMIHIDVEHENRPEDFTTDPETIAAYKEM